MWTATITQTHTAFDETRERQVGTGAPMSEGGPSGILHVNSMRNVGLLTLCHKLHGGD